MSSDKKKSNKRKRKVRDEENESDDEIDGWKFETVDGIPSLRQKYQGSKENPSGPVLLSNTDKATHIECTEDRLGCSIGKQVSSS